MFHLLRKINAFEMCALECFYVDSYASSFYSASHKSFVPDKKWFAFSKIGFCVGTEVFEEALYAVKFLGWLKKFGPAQNILGPVRFDTDDTVTVILKAKRVGKFQLDWNSTECITNVLT